MRRQALAIAAMLACSGPAAQTQVKLPSLPATRVEKTQVAPPIAAPDLKSTLYKMADVLGMLRGPEESESILTLEYWGTGTMNVGGQPYNLTNYRGSVRFNVPGMRVDFTRTGPDGQTPQRQIHVVAGKFAWNETQPGMNATPAPGTVNERLLQMWTLSQGVVKAATVAGTNTKVTLEGGVVYVTFPLPAPTPTTHT